MTMPDVALLIIRLVPVAMAALGLLAIILIVRSRRARLPSLPPAAPGALGPQAMVPGQWPRGEWNAKVDAGGFRPFSGFGRVHLADGRLSFVPDRGEGGWEVATAGIRAGKNTALSSAEVWLIEPSVGQLNLTVSREHINRLSDNDFKDVRERRYADEFLYALHLSGATIDPGH